MSNQWKDDFTDQLCDAIVAITDRDEAYRFLEDLATFSEIKAFSQRLQVAGLLIKGFSYPQIVFLNTNPIYFPPLFMILCAKRKMLKELHQRSVKC